MKLFFKCNTRTCDINKRRWRRCKLGEDEAIQDLQRNTARHSVQPQSNCTARLRTDSSAKAGSVEILKRTSLKEALGFFRSGVPQSCWRLWQDVASLTHTEQEWWNQFLSIYHRRVTLTIDLISPPGIQTAQSCWDVSFVRRYNVKLNHCAVSFLLLFICIDSWKFPAVQHHSEWMKTF